ncbi:MAG: SO_0444 family Cu/Zn efflux transporter [Bacteroidaceae bacterium]|nr:SO_0444 family Cu/Zn efflux transporter [Bacteroidaceae bacterium]
MEKFFVSLWAITLDMAPYLLLGFFIAGLLYAFVPQSIIARHMARPGFRSVLNATLLGIPLPLCSCGVIPTTVGLRRTGASRGACTSFLISTPQTGVDSILATYSVLGLPFAIVRPIAALVTGVLGGVATDHFLPKEQLKENDCSANTHQHHADNHDNKLLVALRYAFGELLEDVGKWLAIGLVIAAIITVAVPDNFFDALRDYPFVNMLIVLAIAIPMYVCATGSIPIALSLMLKGLTPGAALVLLMAGPAINSASMLVINKAFGRKQMVIYIASIVIGAIVFGLGIDYLLPAEWFTPTAFNSFATCCKGEEHGSWLEIGSSVLFLVLLFRALLKGHKHEHHSESLEDSLSSITIQIEGMNCSHCAKNAQGAIESVSGVRSAVVDHHTKTAIITAEDGCNINIAAIEEAISKAGFEVSPLPSPPHKGRGA